MGFTDERFEDLVMETIQIGLAANDDYFCGMLVTASSIARYASSDVTLRFNILDGGISEKHWVELGNSVCREHSKSSFNRIVVDEQKFAEFPQWRGNRMAFARFLLADSLNDVDFVIYSDVDVLWMRDIACLWDLRDRGSCIISTIDGEATTLEREEKWFKERSFPFDRTRYFCSGMCMLNLARMREKGFVGDCITFILEHKDIQYADQTAMNVVGFDSIKIIPKTWQQFPNFITQKQLDEGVVLHYAGENPWRFANRFQMLSDTMMLWHQFNACIRGITGWGSLRLHFGVLQIIWHRFFFWLYNVRVLRFMLEVLLRKTGHGGVAYWWSVRCTRLHFNFSENTRIHK